MRARRGAIVVVNFMFSHGMPIPEPDFSVIPLLFTAVVVSVGLMEIAGFRLRN